MALFKKNKKVVSTELEDFNFRKYTWAQFKKNKLALYSYRFLLVLVVLAFISPILSNDKPLYCKIEGKTYFPALSFNDFYELKNEKISLEFYDWKHAEFESVVWSMCAYSPGKSDALNIALSPGAQQVFKKTNGDLIHMPSKFSHRLGTTRDGGDVLAGLIHGIKYSLLIGILSMLIASIIGVLLGSMAGYFGNTGLKVKRGMFWSLCIGIFLAWFYAFYVRSYTLVDAFEKGGASLFLSLLMSVLLFIVIIIVFYFIGKLLSKLPFFKVIKPLRIDAIISRVIEINNSIPLFLVILAIAAIARPSFVTLILLIGLSNWSGIARLTRGEFLRVSSLDYIQAARSLGLSNWRILFRHALPNAIGPALIAIAFGIAGAILTESGLSFIGVGVPPEIVTWGKILSEAKESTSSWWLIVFPGIVIFLTVTMYNLIGEGLRDALDPKLKN